MMTLLKLTLTLILCCVACVVYLVLRQTDELAITKKERAMVLIGLFVGVAMLIAAVVVKINRWS